MSGTNTLAYLPEHQQRLEKFLSFMQRLDILCVLSVEQSDANFLYLAYSIQNISWQVIERSPLHAS
jgi:hypothetical protein